MSIHVNMMLANKICVTQESAANLSVYFPGFPYISDIWEGNTQTNKKCMFTNSK